MYFGTFVLLCPVLSALQSTICSAALSKQTNPSRFIIEKGMYGRKSRLTMEAPTSFEEDAEMWKNATGFLTTNKEDPATSPYVSREISGGEWNKTCSEYDQFFQGAESFLNYLLRLQRCDALTGSNRLERECLSRRYDYTEYYSASYLRFCDLEMFEKICKKTSFSEVFSSRADHIILNSRGFETSGDASEEDKLAGRIPSLQEIKNYKAKWNSYMLDLACGDIIDFSDVLYRHRMLQSDNQNDTSGTGKHEINRNFFPRVTIPSNLSAVAFSEWYNPIIPFCRPFVCGSSMKKYSLSSKTFYECMPKGCQATIVFSLVFDAVLAVLTIIANSLVLGVAARTKIMRNTPGYFKISLAIADLIVGVFVLPSCLYITYTLYIGPLPFRQPGQKPAITDYISRPVTNFLGFFIVLSLSASIYTMAVASLDRYLAITKPFKYRQGKYLTKRRCVFAFALIWLVGFLVAVYPVFSNEPFGISGFNLVLSTGFTSSIVYAVGLAVPLIAVWSLNGAMLSQVCADGEKRRSIRATSVLNSSTPQISMRSGENNNLSKSVVDSGDDVNTTQEEVTVIPVVADDKKDNDVTKNVTEQEVISKRPVSRNISTSSISYYRNEKRTSVPTGGEGVTERMTKKRGASRAAAAAQRQVVSRQSSITSPAVNVERRLARTLAIMIGAFTLALLPSIFTLIAYISLPNSSSPQASNNIATVLYLTSRISLSNSFWNCIIYSIRNRHFRRAMWAIFLCKKEKIDQRLRYSVTMSQWKRRRSAGASSSGSSLHEKQGLSKTISGSSNASVYHNMEHRRSTLMWSLSSAAPSPSISRKGSSDILEDNKMTISRCLSANMNMNTNSNNRPKVARCESAPAAQDCQKMTIPTVTVEMITEINDNED